MAGRQIAHREHVVAIGDQAAGVVVDRLHDHRGQVAGREGVLDGGQIVPGRDDDEFGESRWDAGGIDARLQELPGGRLTRRRMGAVEHELLQPVEMTFELEDLAAAGVSAGRANGHHRRFRTRVGVADQFGAGNQLGQAPGQLRLIGRLRAVNEPEVESPLYRGADAGVVVSQDRGTEPGEEIEVSSAVGRDDIGTISAGGQHGTPERRILAGGARHAADEHPRRLAEVDLVSGRSC